MALIQYPYLTLVASADWSCSPKKRWGALATREPGGQFRAEAPFQIADAAGLLSRLCQRTAQPGSLLLGFDFPIGVPAHYAARAKIGSFLELLPKLGRESWHDFFQVANQPQEISLYRPFYPNAPGGRRLDHLLLALDLDRDSLYRQCDLAQAYRRPASPLFWTMGAQQVGKAALNGWQSVLQPALALVEPQVSLWPFSGRLDELLQPGKAVIAEIYPAEYYHLLGIRLGKRSPAARLQNANALFAWAEENSLALDPRLEATIRLGFLEELGGEDAFDAVIGLFGMLAALRQSPETLEPEEGRIRDIEGWILGQTVGEKC